jgi:hypothetical protein
MALKAKANNKSGGGDQCPAGMHPGVCVGILDLGTHWESYQGSAPHKVRKVWLVWEVEAEFQGKDKRFYLGREFGIRYDDQGELSLHTKNKLRELLEEWRNKKYGEEETIEVDAVLGRDCQVNVIQETRSTPTGQRTYATIKAVANLAKGQAKIKPSFPTLNYSADSDEPYPGPEWVPLPFGIKIEDYLENAVERGGTGKRDDLLKKKKPQLPGEKGTSAGPADENAGGGHTDEESIPF